MKTTQLIFLGCLSWVVTVAKARDLNSPLTDIPEKLQTESTDLAKQTKSHLDENLTSSEASLNEIIPSVDQLTNKSDPIKLGEQIENITDPKKRKELIQELKTAANENKNTLAGKFYEAAYQYFTDEEKASKMWTNELNKVTTQAIQRGSKVVTVFDQGVGDYFPRARKILELDPLGIALRGGDAVLLTVLSDASKNIGKVSDLVYDTAGNIVGVNRVLTGRIQGIPIVGQIKSNVDGLVDEGLKRGKFLVGSLAETGAKTFGTLAADSTKKANEKQAAFDQYVAEPASSSV
ncbi:uncharacterized protein LOC135848250 [Planococcus citri]|uniref:uncharacterized protein LOC135848250 n=1 Tax=Planococcus citri TaxID=170843 RepID=UPI0031F78501